MSQLFKHPVKIYYEDTDFTGVVYYANYLRFFERGRTEAMGAEQIGRDYDDEGLGLVVYKADLTFLKPARYGDEVEVRTQAHTDGEYRLIFEQEIYRGDEPRPLVQGTIGVAQVDRKGRLVPMGQWLRDRANGQ